MSLFSPPSLPPSRMPISHAHPLGEVAELILRDLGRNLAMTSHTLLWRTRIARGLTADHGHLVIQKLIGMGLVGEQKENPRLGTASQRFLALTPAATILYGHAHKKVLMTMPWERIRYHAQAALVGLDYAMAGWIPVASPEVWAHLIHAVRLAVRGRTLTSSEHQELSLLAKRTVQDVGLDAWVSPAGEVRLRLPAYRGKDLRTTLTATDGDALAAVSRWVPLEIIIVMPDHSDHDAFTVDRANERRTRAVLRAWAAPSGKRGRAAARKTGATYVPMRTSTLKITYGAHAHLGFLHLPNPKVLGGLTPSAFGKQRCATTTGARFT